MHKKTILIADNQVFVKEGIKSMVSNLPDFEITGEANCSKELFSELETKSPDVIIMDYDLPGYFCLQDIQTIHFHYPEINILIISANQLRTDIMKALEYGIQNYILKLCDKQEFLDALHACARQERFFCYKIIDAILDHQINSQTNCEGVCLSDREIEIIRLIAEGCTNNDIAERLFLSIHTIGTHRKNIMRKLQLNKSSELIMYAIKNGVVRTA